MKTLTLTKISYITLFSIVLFIFSGCKKEKSKIELLTSGSWKYLVITSNPPIDFNGDSIMDPNLLPFLPSCITNDFFTFKEDGSLIVDEGGSKCDQSIPQTYTQKWEFLDNQTKIDFGSIIVGKKDVRNIVELNEKTFVVSKNDTSNGKVYLFTTYLIKK